VVTADGLLESLTERIASMLGPQRVLIGIAGPPGAGKSTLAAALTTRLAGGSAALQSPVTRVPMDGFHLADAALDLLGLRDRKGAPETFDALGYGALLARIGAGEFVWAPAFERDLEQPIAGSIPVSEATRIVLSEGNYLLLPDEPWPTVRAQFSEVWYVRLDDAVRRARLIRRHVEFGKSPEEAEAWVAGVDDRNAALVAASAAAADHIVDLTGIDF
jgi:pantothenate kinase